MAISQPDQFIALLGGGQLGKMLLAEARRMDLSVHSMDPDHMAPCRLGSHRFVQGDFTDYHQVMDFSQGATAVVIEIESVNVKALEDLEAQGIPTFPSAKALRLIQNKIKQKTFYRDQGIPTSDFQVHANHASLQSAIAEDQLTMPFVWKLAEGGYDGFGVAMINKASDIDNLPDLPCITEAAVEIDKEIAVVIVRDRHGNTEAFPPVEMAFHPTANQVE
ncbi:MAG: ATP-grasp domain-containing protein, partial [Flavobacteriales bacterium]|nr:ATP-grasp domain-containing protein [Flavobacteriales bacterium]